MATEKMVSVTVRLAPEVMDKCKELAESAGCAGVPQWLRTIAEAEAEGPAHAAFPSTAADAGELARLVAELKGYTDKLKQRDEAEITKTNVTLSRLSANFKQITEDAAKLKAAAPAAPAKIDTEALAAAIAARLPKAAPAPVSIDTAKIAEAVTDAMQVQAAAITEEDAEGIAKAAADRALALAKAPAIEVDENAIAAKIADNFCGIAERQLSHHANNFQAAVENEAANFKSAVDTITPKAAQVLAVFQEAAKQADAAAKMEEKRARKASEGEGGIVLGSKSFLASIVIVAAVLIGAAFPAAWAFSSEDDAARAKNLSNMILWNQAYGYDPAQAVNPFTTDAEFGKKYNEKRQEILKAKQAAQQQQQQ